ncbi:D-alanyl-D-alanine carboxypeptidase/D-alanyl-D-alanine endopeptidase [Cysteiniphilum litorale]|uniref:D-alanyl-D-alanine carboxypeptidase/D-alanyl-D-alanine endopeptidase n=1 Tax=Cysteiniphilum litorale TaxID=2056700 RepID=UPI003F88318F
MVKKFILLSYALISTITFAHASVRSEIQSLVKMYRLSDVSIGIAVERVNSGQLLYQYAKDRPFTPASNNKVFTAVAALTALPKSFQFTTSVFYKKSQYKNGTLNGNLYIEFTGDPSLTGAALYNLISQTKQHGIKRINGDVVLIANHFSGDYVPNGWSKNDTPYCFAAPASSLNMNKNCFVIKLINTSGTNTKVKEIANTSNITINNTTRLATAQDRGKCKFDIDMTRNNVLNLSGCIPAKAETYLNLAIANPALKTKQTIDDFISQVGIKHRGNTLFGNLPSKSSLIEVASISSDSIDALLTHMLLKSDNLYAESFMRTIGYTQAGQGSNDAGTKAIESLIRKTYKVDTGELHMEDGSGLSKLDSVTPQFMVSLLTNVYNSSIGKRLYNALPSSGEDGTLAYRMGGKLQGRVHAKTGTLAGVSTLSGYLLTKRNHLLSFSIMINDLTRSQRIKARMLEDGIIKVFYENL